MHGSPPTREVRLVRTVLACAVLLALISALSGYLLHGRGQSANAKSAGAAATSAAQVAAPKTTPAQPSAWTTPSASASATKTPTETATPTSGARRSASGKPGPVPAKGNGKFSPVLVPQRTTAKSGRTVTYSLQVEGGMHADSTSIATGFGGALLDRRGWQGVDGVRFVQLTPSQVEKGAKPQITVLVASPDRVNTLCAPLRTHGSTSCDTSAHVVLNYRLWMRGVSDFKGDIGAYREYMVNHEVGHALGHGHQHCAKAGTYAPVMEQQTLGLQGCKPWPWPKRPNSHGTA